MATTGLGGIMRWTIAALLAVFAAAAWAQDVGGSLMLLADQVRRLVHDVGDPGVRTVGLVHDEDHGELGEKIIRKLRAGLMPPSGMRRPDPSASAALRLARSVLASRSSTKRLVRSRPGPGSTNVDRVATHEVRP